MSFPETENKPATTAGDDRIEKTEAEWREILTPEQYHVLRQKGTERAFSNSTLDENTAGDYLCAGCGSKLFESSTKFDSGSGWPSFYAPSSPDAVETETDGSAGMERVEVLCSKCGGHLGHVFNDGPAPTGQRYCINAVSLKKKA